MTGSASLMSGRERVSPYAAILFFLLLSGPPRLLARDPMASVRGEIGTGVVVNALVLGLALLWVLNELNFYALKRRALPRLGSVEIAFLLFVIMLVPSLYVSSALPLSVYRILQLLIGFLFSAAWLRRFGVERSLRHVHLGLIWLAVLTVVFAVMMPGQMFFGGRLLGGALTSVPVVAVLLVIFTLGRSEWVDRSLRYALQTLGVVLALLSRTRSAIAALAVTILLAALNSSSRPTARRVLLFVAGLLPALALVGLEEPLFAFLLRDKASWATLSDRVPLWGAVVDYVWARSPWVGIGHMTSRLLTLQINPRIGSTHNLFVEVFVGAGVIGLLGLFGLLVTLVVQASRAFFYRAASPEAFILLASLAALVLMSLLSDDALNSSTLGFLFVMLPALSNALLRPAGRASVVARDEAA